MATFSTKKILYGPSALIPAIAERIQEEFSIEGYDVTMDALSSGGYDISISKGGFFKAIMGMKTALKVTLVPNSTNIIFEAGVGIWGQQVIPTAITIFLFQPLIFAQLWGMIEQSKLDDKAYQIANSVVVSHAPAPTPQLVEIPKKFCTECGSENVGTAKFCSGCGKPL